MGVIKRLSPKKVGKPKAYRIPAKSSMAYGLIFFIRLFYRNDFEIKTNFRLNKWILELKLDSFD